MDKNDVDITVDVELLREEFYRIKKSTSLLPLRRGKLLNCDCTHPKAHLIQVIWIFKIVFGIEVKPAKK